MPKDSTALPERISSGRWHFVGQGTVPPSEWRELADPSWVIKYSPIEMGGPIDTHDYAFGTILVEAEAGHGKTGTLISALRYPSPPARTDVDERRRPRELAWLTATTEAFERAADLPANWDSYNARPVEKKVFIRAQAMLTSALPDNAPAPSVVPTPTGGLMLEWHRRGLDLEIEVTDDGRTIVAYEDRTRGEDWEEEFTDDRDRLAAVMGYLVERR